MQTSDIDKSNIRKVIEGFPEQFKTPVNLSRPLVLKKEIKNIIVCGMGGSAWPTNILNCWLQEKSPAFPLPIYIHRDYNLPAEANENSFVICSSYSGNTEEPVSALEEAIKRNYMVSALTSGGKIEEICQKNEIPFAKIPSGLQPRMGTGYLFKGLIEILVQAKLINDISAELESLTKNLEEINLKDLEVQGRVLAKKLVNKILLIYASNKFKAVARIWKIKFNENSKTTAFYNYFPELNHNEMNGFINIPKGSKLHIIIIRDKNDHPHNLKRMNIFSQLLEEKGVKTDFIDIKEGDILFKLFSTLVLGDWVSYYLALEYKVDPTPVEMVEVFKKRMGE